MNLKDNPLLEEGNATAVIAPRISSASSLNAEALLEVVDQKIDNHHSSNSQLYPSAQSAEMNTSPANGSCVLEDKSPYPNLSDIENNRHEEPQRQHLLTDEENMPPPPVITPQFNPPDGGCRGILVVIASFLCNGIIFGTINSTGVIYDELHSILEEKGQENPGALASLTMSLTIGTTFFLSVLSGVLTDRLGIRITAALGAALATFGMFISSLVYDRAELLLVSFGLMFGAGASLAYTPSLVILAHYFKRRIGLVNGIVTAGSSFFTIGNTFLIKYTIAQYDLRTTFQILTAMMAVLVLCAAIFKPLMPSMPSPSKYGEKTKGKKCCSNINVEIWRNKKYVIWVVAIASSLFGYFVPYVHLVKYAKDTLGKDANTEILVQCIGATSGVGRIIFGFIADHPKANRIVLQQISFFSIGTLTLCLSGSSQFWMFIVISLLMGMFDGCFISLLGPIAFDIVGPANASQAIGCLLALCSFPLTLGPLFAGWLYDMLGSYFIPFMLAGLPPIFGATALFSLLCIKSPPEGMPGSPVRDTGEIQNNATVVSSSAAASQGVESHALIMGPLKHKTGTEDEQLQVDVGRLVALQKESCV